MDKENFFAFYGLPFKFLIDENQLRQEYLKISRENHPDFFANQIEKQAEVMKLSAYNNKAYSTLKSFDSRVEYILTQSGLYDKEQKTGLSQSFLMEMMEWNEKLAEAGFDDEVALSKIKAEIVQEKNKVEQELIQLCTEYDNQPVSEKLKEIAVIFEKQKYYLKLLSSKST